MWFTGGGRQHSEGLAGLAVHLRGARRPRRAAAGAGGRGAALSPVRAGQSRAGRLRPAWGPGPQRGWSRIGPGRTFTVSPPKITVRLFAEPGGAAASQIRGL